MSSSSSSSSRNWRYQVFPSFCGQDVRKGFLSHFLEELKRKGIITFIDNEIRRSDSIGPELVRAIRESRISIVVLSKSYASSSWCLNELLEIMRCREEKGQTAMTIFYEVDPSDVRKKTGDFGTAFKTTCEGQTEEQKQRWSRSLLDVANIAGEHSQKWDNEAHMIQKIATDVSNELNSTPSSDLDDFVGIESHMRRINSLLCLESNEVRMVGIWGPAGIGKTTIARALHSRHSRNFEHHIFMENVKGCYREIDLDDYGLKLRLQKQFLSKIIDQKDIEMRHLGVLEERLKDLKVLIVLDGVDKIEQLDALASQTRWFGSGSRIIVTTEDKQLLKAHGINLMYKVDFPSRENALEIFCRSAFRDNYPPDGFLDLAVAVAELAGNLPLGLRVLGSTLLGKSKDEWRYALPRLRTSLSQDIAKILRLGYDGLDERDKAIFLHIACLFNREHVDHVIHLLEISDLDVKIGLQVLEDKSLIDISSKHIVMHYLLQKMGREIVRSQSVYEPGKRQFLVDAKEIYDVLIDNTGTGTILGIDLNTSEITDELFIHDSTFERMRNLQFLRLYKKGMDETVRINLPQGLDFLPRKLRLLHWHAYPLDSMPVRFCPKFLVELSMTESSLEKLWEGPQPLPSLKRMNLSLSKNLKQIPDLSTAENLEELILQECNGLVMLPSSIRNLSKLRVLDMRCCENLEILPTNINLESLAKLNFNRCLRLKSFPEISTSVEAVSVGKSAVAEVPSSVRLWSRLETLHMPDCENLKTFPYVPSTIRNMYLDNTGIEEVPSWVDNLSQLSRLFMTNCKKLKWISASISKLQTLEWLTFSGCENVASFHAEIFPSFQLTHQLNLGLSNIHYRSLPTCLSNAPTFPVDLHLSNNDFESIPDFIKYLPQLRSLDLSMCRKLKSLPELPDSLRFLNANDCESLERITCPFRNPEIILNFGGCLKLGIEARDLIQKTVCKCRFLPGGEVPTYFTHRANGSSLSIHLVQRPLMAFLRLKACFVLAAETYHTNRLTKSRGISCRFKGNRHGPAHLYELHRIGAPLIRTDHLCILDLYCFLDEENDPKAASKQKEILLEFRCDGYEVIECGVRILQASPSPGSLFGCPKIWTYICEEDGDNNHLDGSYEVEASNNCVTDCKTEDGESEDSNVLSRKRCREEEEVENVRKPKRLQSRRREW